MIAGWAVIALGIAATLSQVPTLHPDLRIFGAGLLLAFLGGLMVSDRPRRG